MKKWIALCLLAVLLLTGCSPVSYEVDGVTVTMDWEKKQLSDGKYTYEYNWEKDDTGEKLTVRYPNGKEQFCQGKDGNIIASTGQMPDDSTDYTDIETFYAAVYAKRLSHSQGFQGLDGSGIIFVVMGLCLIILGIFVVSAPESAWYLSVGRLTENGEPTLWSLRLFRIYGVAVILGGLFMIGRMLLGAFGLL